MNIMEYIKDKKMILIVVLFIGMVAGLITYSNYSGLFLIFSLLVFGLLSLFWKEKHIKLAALTALLLLAVLNIGINGMKFGIDFSGGTRIPVILEQPVDQETMNELIDIVKKRSNVLGLTEVKVRAVGDSKIEVEVPTSNEENIAFIEEVLSHQGVYQGIVDGKVALTGEDILPGTIRKVQSVYLPAQYDWAVSFTITSESAKEFSKIVFEKANYPLYMFLDRPVDAIIVMKRSEFIANAPVDSTYDDLLDVTGEVLVTDKDEIEMYIYGEDEIPEAKTNYTKAVISEDISLDAKTELENKGYRLLEVTSEEISPMFSEVNYGFPEILEWDAIGLLSSPRLGETITDGSVHTFYQIGGTAQGTSDYEKAANADESVKRIVSILEGGALPVQISLGSKTVLPPTLGNEFLNLSLIGIVAALVLISLFIGLRYLKINLILPIILISITELIILLSILGSFTIDLAAMAGIIAAIGVSVDAQIVITDELLKKTVGDIETRLGNAFQIIKTNVIVAIVAMIPLLFSGMTEVIGFAISTILGALLGYMLSRPAYAAIVEDIIGE